MVVWAGGILELTYGPATGHALSVEIGVDSEMLSVVLELIFGLALWMDLRRVAGVNLALAMVLDGKRLSKVRGGRFRRVWRASIYVGDTWGLLFVARTEKPQCCWMRWYWGRGWVG